VVLAELCATLEQTFAQIARDKSLEFGLTVEQGLPPAIWTDSRRLQQVLKNLLSNAFKFTEHGAVVLRIAPATGGWSPDHELLNRAGAVVAFAVSDTGIGIAADKQRVIFEAFQQADGTTSRKYGGTGLGLSISREIARLLGGEIRLESTPGEGSIFTLYLPLASAESRLPSAEPERTDTALLPTNGREASLDQHSALSIQHSALSTQHSAQPSIPDDRDLLQPSDRVLLIIEDDPTFARIMLDSARTQGFKGIVALQGNAGLALARRFKPDAVTLDLVLPDIGGWTIFDQLKRDAATRHIPIHIISGIDERQRGLELGAIAYLQKPLTQEALDAAFTQITGFLERTVKSLLVVEDDEAQRKSIVELIGNGDVLTVPVGSGAEALEALEHAHFDCMVLDLGLPDMPGVELIRRVKQLGLTGLPIIIYTGKEISRKEETELKRISDAIIVKDVTSMERLLAETALFLHRVEANLPLPTRQMLEQFHKLDPVLVGKKVLIIDDDVRNIFALTSVLERYQMQVAYAENGKDGIEMLQNTPDVNIVLMDVMMPELDGYETMRAIRKQRKYKHLPIIALTAKAMKGDREKCIEAGASDYITKPVDTEQLISLLRVWLYK
jgi:CheY-like chemotaxis protein